MKNKLDVMTIIKVNHKLLIFNNLGVETHTPIDKETINLIAKQKYSGISSNFSLNEEPQTFLRKSDSTN